MPVRQVASAHSQTSIPSSILKISGSDLTGSNGCAMDTRDAAPEPAAALREDECELVLYVGGKVVRVAHTKQEMRVAIAGLGMI